MAMLANSSARLRAHWWLAALLVIPAPRSVTETGGSFEFHPGTVVTADSREALPVATQFAERVRALTGLTLEVREQAAPAERAPARMAAAVSFRLNPDAARSAEAYRLVVEPQGVTVESSDVAGLRNGAVTLWQLLATNLPATSSKTAQLRVPGVSIDDAPQFRWRGLMLDSARHYQSPEFIEHYLDWMALHKLNVLHWHLVDDQAWRLEIRRYPKLTQVGAWRVPAGRAARRNIDPRTGRPKLYGGYYSQATVRHLVRYAAERGITIVPEIEMPGHASAAIAAYPELGVAAADVASKTSDPASVAGSSVHAATSVAAVPSDWGIYPNLFNVEESTFTFLERVLDEVLELFPGRYVHVGGDEAVKDQWRMSPRVQARMRELGVKDEAALQGYFVARIGRYLDARGRRLVGWDEILDGGIPADATVMSWRGVEGARKAAQSGHDAVLAAWPTLYFDNRQGAAVTEPPGRGRVVSLRDVYQFDLDLAANPPPGAATAAGTSNSATSSPPLTADELRHVIGIQGNVWTEHVRTEERVEWMTWPRAAAVAELGWSAPVHRDYEDFRQRLLAATQWYRALGLRAATSEFEAAAPRAPDARWSQELEQCTDKLVLNLEDDAPVYGPRAKFLVDIMNPCWRWRAVDLSHGATLVADVGQFPFNFQIGQDRNTIVLRPPSTPSGELEVRSGDCVGPVLASLPLSPALDNDAVTRLPPVALAPSAVIHDLCFTFTGRTIDPMWAIDRVELRLPRTTLTGGAPRVR